jgi:hypothetical protein
VKNILHQPSLFTAVSLLAAAVLGATMEVGLRLGWAMAELLKVQK